MNDASRSALVQELHQQAPLTDVHVHPSLKSWLFNRSIWNRGLSTNFLNPWSDRSSLSRVHNGGFRVLLVTHHIPEAGLFEDSWLLKFLIRVVGMNSKLRNGSSYQRLTEMMDYLDKQVAGRRDGVELVETPGRLSELLETDKLILLHAVEGGHVLEGNLENLNKLADRGVVSLTLTHFFPNDIGRNVDSIPDSFFFKKFSNYESEFNNVEPLTEFGKDVLTRMQSLGMLPDITHTAPEGRKAIYNHVPSGFPLVATHVGLHELCPDPMNLTDDELVELANRNGAVGLIFFKYFLDRRESSDIFEALWKSIKHIHDVTGSWDHIMVGTDFDGFTSPSPELQHAGDFPAFTKMLLDRGLSHEAIRKILGGNAIRIIKQVWEKRPGSPDDSQRTPEVE
ncbi:MAG: dipeptidase [bacterium]